MTESNETTYSQRVAVMYDELYAEYDPASINLLAEPAAHGRALELGIGTGRIAVPLHERCILVQGEVSQLDSAAQQVTTEHVLLSENGIRLFPVRLRYAWPSELDLMAQIAGLSLRHPWGSC